MAAGSIARYRRTRSRRCAMGKIQCRIRTRSGSGVRGRLLCRGQLSLATVMVPTRIGGSAASTTTSGPSTAMRRDWLTRVPRTRLAFSFDPDHARAQTRVQVRQEGAQGLRGLRGSRTRLCSDDALQIRWRSCALVTREIRPVSWLLDGRGRWGGQSANRTTGTSARGAEVC